MTEIVVGVDGSEGCQVAVRWACAEAGRRRVGVRAILGWTTDGDPAAVYRLADSRGLPLAEAARVVLRDVLQAATGGPGEPALTAQVLDGWGADVLLEAGRDAEMLVVGARGSGLFHRMVTGSVCTSVTTRAAVPVVVARAAPCRGPRSAVPAGPARADVPGSTDAHVRPTRPAGPARSPGPPPAPGPAGSPGAGLRSPSAATGRGTPDGSVDHAETSGTRPATPDDAPTSPPEGTPDPPRCRRRDQRIVVGVDGSAGARAALRWAAGEAELHDAELGVVHAWQAAALSPFGDADAQVMLACEDQSRALLDQLVRDELGAAGPVVPTLSLVPGSAAPALIAASREAELLVIGAGGRGRLASILLGSVSRECITGAATTVAVIPPP